MPVLRNASNALSSIPSKQHGALCHSQRGYANAEDLPQLYWALTTSVSLHRGITGALRSQVCVACTS